MSRLLNTAQWALKRVAMFRGAQAVEIAVRGRRVHYFRVPGEGVGPPVVLLHGLGGSATGFVKTFHRLAKHFSAVWAPDLPGNGFSPVPQEGPLSLYALADVAKDFVRDVVGQPVFLIGNSLGGAMAMKVASDAPEWVQALALVAPAGAQLAPERVSETLRAFDVRTVKDSRAMTRRLFHRPPLAMLAFAGELRTLYGSPAVKKTVGEITPQDAISPETLAKLVMPTLLIWGKSEKVLPYESIHYFRANLPRHAEVHEVDGFGHIPQMERPEELVRRLVAFAGRLPAVPR